MNSQTKNNFKWIPWRRYVLFLSIDNSKKNNPDSKEGFGDPGVLAIDTVSGIYPGDF